MLDLPLKLLTASLPCMARGRQLSAIDRIAITAGATYMCTCQVLIKPKSVGKVL